MSAPAVDRAARRRNALLAELVAIGRRQWADHERDRNRTAEIRAELAGIEDREAER